MAYFCTRVSCEPGQWVIGLAHIFPCPPFLMAVFKASIWIVFQVLVSAVQFIFCAPWLSSTLTFIGLHCLESALDRGTAGVLINTPPNLCFPRVYLVLFLSSISFLCLPTLVVDLSTEVPLPFQWTTLAEEFCKAFPDYAHHMFFSILYSCAFRGW